MHKSCKEDHCKRGPIILNEKSNIVLEERTGSNDTANVADCKHKESNDDGEVESLARSLAAEDLNPLLEINEGYIEAEDVAGEASHVFEAIACVCYSKDPVHYQGPPEGLSDRGSR
jgi:hypothetical protein